MTSLLFVALALLAPGEDCPWINTATASGILHSAASVEVRPSSCTFTTNGSTLHIEVNPSHKAAAIVKHAQARCESKATPLVGIGNEAFACGDKVVGRVRDQVFVIIVTEPRSSASGSSVDPRVPSQRARLAASQVSGMLY